MSKLTDLYETSKTPVDDRIQSEKNILLVVPDKKHDIGPVLSYLGLSPFEVALTWPKKTVDAVDEIDAVGAKVVLQVDCLLTRKRHSINTQDLKSLDPYRESVREAIADKFVCLHHHDEFSIKDGLGTIGSFDFKKKQWKGLLGLLKAQRRSFCCITNHGSVGGWIKQYNACKKAGVKALFGMEAYTSNYRGDDPEMKKAHRSANHLVLIANNDEGFFNIIRIHNDAQLNGFYYTPRVNREALEKWGKGIIGMSACTAGELPRLLMEGKDTEAKEFWEFHSRVFDAFYIEIQIIEAEEQREANRRLIQFARSVGAPLVLSCDSHYLDPEYAETHDMLMCLRQKKTIMDKREKDDVWSFDVRNLYYRDAAAMRQVFENGYVTEDGTQYAPFLDDVFTEDVFNEAIANTRKIAVETQNIKLD
jgi:DNA polymerase III alpha subunit